MICENFFAHCDQSRGPEACWPFLRSKNSRGYGKVWVDGRCLEAHRFAYSIENGSVPDGLCVLHHCDNPPCCNPSHLYAGTQKQNAADRENRGRGNQPKGEASGTSALSTRDVIFIRRCRDLYNTEEMARMLGVQRGTIANILRGAAWSHVRDTPLGQAAIKAAE